MKPYSSEKTSWILGDGHVHIHESFQLKVLFDAALHNFQHTARSLDIEGNIDRILLLTESAGADFFDHIRRVNHIPTGSTDGFTVQPTDDPNCLRIESTDGRVLHIIAGRQIVTAESLEVLALGLDQSYPDGKPITAVLEDLKTKNCLMTLPWGAGKWLGKRGKIIRETVQAFKNGKLFLGDNGNRPFFWPLPGIFSESGKKGIANIPGSDPLPFKNQEKRIGSFGFLVPGHVNPATPCQSLFRILTETDIAIQSYGKTEKLLPFLFHQISMQLVKTRRKIT